MKFTRRTGIFAATSAILALSLSACGSTAEPNAAKSDAPAASSDFTPVTIKNIYGETTIDKAPERVATISWVNADTLLALDTVPVGMDTDNYGQNANNSTDWKDAALEKLGASIGTEKAPQQYAVGDDPDYDAIARSKPDVIFAPYSGLKKEQYEKLEKIAPVVGPIEANYTTSWQEATTAAGQMLGKQDEAKTLISDVEAKMAKVGEEHPVLKDTSFIAADLSSPDTAYVYSTGDTRPRFLSSIGMKQAPYVDKNAAKDAFFFTVSPEKVNEWDADVVFASAPQGQSIKDVIKTQPLYGQIPAVKSDAVALPGTDQATLAISAASPLSIEWALENVVPMIVTAADNAAAKK
ncbi:Fe3+-hydroxamate ABC transporter substrate-binding protein [Glutamicibacter uratoxydans]|uniref:Fe3+-hydroxamate ABC transporter substrate-binding protein n=1 Tax=Glutamicibacter uratoxydans TaxID=43667 RepID=A0A4Y4DRY1_GLUUR|nr:iron-siderophore ABC transporter substrate-binding protein [Glutamicibacter uratoxydans]GED07676.1 Fe3+-hydroxamate ABC transporter substrate-binding protein [Glutamicibacter uratoxydans]